MIAFQQIRKIREKALPSKNEKSTSHAVPRLVRDEIMFVLVCVWEEGCYIPFSQHLLKILNVFFPDQGDFDARKKNYQGKIWYTNMLTGRKNFENMI